MKLFCTKTTVLLRSLNKLSYIQLLISGKEYCQMKKMAYVGSCNFLVTEYGTTTATHTFGDIEQG